MADQHPEPDFSEDPRGQDVGQGYPESQSGEPGDGGDSIGQAPYPDSSERGGTEGEGPSMSGEEDEDPGHATGNPRAAG